MNKKISIGLSIVAIIIIASVLGSYNLAKANRTYFAPTVQTGTATTTTTSLTTGNNTTLILDAYNTVPAAINSATLLLQVVSSSSASTLTITPAYSQDGIDYFENNLASSTTSNNITQGNYSLLTGNTTSSTTRKAISVLTPVRFVKLTISATIGTSTIWAQIVPAREVTN